jgi:ubiquinone/menaquinone biosynthesis C-methylase UbiE
MLPDRVDRERDQALHDVVERLAMPEIPDHLKAGYSADHFLARSRQLRREFERQRRLLETRGRQSAPLKVLDVGCGNGVLTDFVLDPDLDRYGVDFASGMIEQATNKYPNIKFCVGNCYELPFPDQSFDIAVSFGLLQMVSGGERLVRELVRVVTPGGFGLIEFLPRLSLLDLAARAPFYLARGQWSQIRSLAESRRMVHTWNGRPVQKYRPSEVVAALRSCKVASARYLSRRYFFLSSLIGGVVSFVR